jgi:hypothetical protein
LRAGNGFEADVEWEGMVREEVKESMKVQERIFKKFSRKSVIDSINELLRMSHSSFWNSL